MDEAAKAPIVVLAAAYGSFGIERLRQRGDRGPRVRGLGVVLDRGQRRVAAAAPIPVVEAGADPADGVDDALMAPKRQSIFVHRQALYGRLAESTHELAP